MSIRRRTLGCPVRAALALAIAASGAATALAADEPVTMSLDQQRTIGLVTAVVSRRALVRSVRVPGRIELDPGHVAALRPLEPVRVLRLLVRPGDPVKAGQALLLLSSARVASDEATLPEAEVALAEATTGVAVAHDAWHRAVTLAADGAFSRAEAETRRLLLAQASAKAASARAELRRLKEEIARYGATPAGDGSAVLRSPIGGVVVRVDATEGGTLDPGAATPAVTVADLSEVVASAEVKAGDAFGIAAGGEATVALADPGQASRRWSGRVTAVGAVADTLSNTIPVRVALANPGGALKGGLFVTVDLLVPTGVEGLTVPPDAIQIVGSRRVAFTPVARDRFAVHDIDLGIQRSGWTEVRKGLEAGEVVVTHGSFELKAVLQKSLLGGG